MRCNQCSGLMVSSLVMVNMYKRQGYAWPAGSTPAYFTSGLKCSICGHTTTINIKVT